MVPNIAAFKCTILNVHQYHYVSPFNLLVPGRFRRNFRKVIFQLVLVIDGWRISCKTVLKWMPMDLTDGKPTLVQVMAWCRQATSHNLSQCWPRSLSPYGVIRPQWFNMANLVHQRLAKKTTLFRNICFNQTYTVSNRINIMSDYALFPGAPFINMNKLQSQHG